MTVTIGNIIVEEPPRALIMGYHVGEPGVIELSPPTSFWAVQYLLLQRTGRLMPLWNGRTAGRCIRDNGLLYLYGLAKPEDRESTFIVDGEPL
jgi:hypothetical protein